MDRTYHARYLNAAARPDGPLNPSAWQQADVLSQFAFPWEDRPAPRTEFRALFDDRSLHFSFQVEDDDVVLAEPFRNKMDVVKEDRVELFFAVDEQLARYYCLEIDPLGRVLDYRAAYYREFDFAWRFPGLSVTGRRTSDGYQIEGRLPWTAFESLGFPLPGSRERIRFGVYRAEFRHTGEAAWSESWISWIDPQTQTPDFHVPQSFGFLELPR